MDELVGTIVVALGSSAVTGMITVFGTTKSLGVHVAYIRETLEKHHVRIDRLEQK